MIKRPKPGDTEDDILRMEQEFLAQRAKNPQIRAAAEFIKVPQPTKKSLFAKSREQQKGARTTQATPASVAAERAKEQLLGDIREKIVGDAHGTRLKDNISSIVLGDITEKTFTSATLVTNKSKVEHFNSNDPKKGTSIFARSFAAQAKLASKDEANVEPMDSSPVENIDLSRIYGNKSVIVVDEKTAAEVHAQNMSMLSQMSEQEILAERKKLLNSIDPSLIALLSKKRHAKGPSSVPVQSKKASIEVNHSSSTDIEMANTSLDELPDSCSALDLIKQSEQENWLNFDVVEKDKLEWMRDIPAIAAKLKPGEKFEARFDWKGVLLPYSLDDITDKDKLKTVHEERELYLHGTEPNRPGYTLHELFRLARSNVLQQRISAFGAIGGLLNIYNQGFYDNVLEVPISKIFFLLRLGWDDNTPAQLESVSNALAFLFYNETDEVLLDYIFDNADCYWQPTLNVSGVVSDDDDPTSIENLQKHMKQLRVSPASISANVEESEEDSRTSMTDFQLAETDLIDCFLRTNVLKRIYFILNTVRMDNSTVTSCLKLLIRLARTNKQTAEQIINEPNLLDCLFTNFMPNLAHVDTSQQQPPFYNYPQFLCLKLLRVLISQHLSIALILKNTSLLDLLQNYLYNREDIRTKLIRVQIEALRILRCMLLQRVIDHKTFKQFLPALRQMLDWHYNHCVYEVGGPALIRQHASALLAAIAASGDCGGGDLEMQKLLGDTLHDCCCSWLHRATRGGEGIKEYSQATLLCTCIDVMNWYARHCIDATRLRNFTTKYLPELVRSKGFAECVNNLTTASIILRTTNDRRNVHKPLPNVGAVLMNQHGPQLVITQTYSVQLLCAIWRLLEQQLARDEKFLFDALLQPHIIEPLARFLRAVRTELNPYLATNFFARSELQLIYHLVCFKGFDEYLSKAELFQLVYNFLCCLPATQAHQIKTLFDNYIFNPTYIDVETATLEKWRQTCLELIYKHIVATNREPTLSLPYTQAAILPKDWPYFQLSIMLRNYVDNVQQKPAVLFSECEVLRMTFNFVNQLEACGMQIATPTEHLMYLMIAFMGPDSQFLDAEMQKLLRANVLNFYARNEQHKFDFDAVYADKCKFENLYALFVDHFQAASYGDELFSSLVLIPMAQKYDNKWRRRMWSDYGNALRFLNCDERLLLGGLVAYLEPVEEEVSLVKAYAAAINSNLVRPGTISYKIAKHHIDNFKQVKCKENPVNKTT